MADPAPEPRKGTPDPTLDEAEFRRRFLSQYPDPAFEPLKADLERIAGAAWEAYSQHRKSPVTRKAGPGYADPGYDLAADWLAAKAAVEAATARHDDPSGPARILLIVGSARNEHSCPGEMSKSYRLAQVAREVFEAGAHTAVELLDLSRTTSEYGRKIHPCKGCFSTAAALCHWPCSCYPNYAVGQTQDWMNEIYPLWSEAHGVMIVTPVNWYQSPSPLKLMTDRLVCADGGNPDPTRTQGKDARLAKAIELEGWDYPKPMDGKLFSVVTHGDVEGADTVRRALSDWLGSMGLRSAGTMAEVDRYIGYFEPYATSHLALDKDLAIQEETRNAARTLLDAVQAARADRPASAGDELTPPRQK